MIEEADGCHSDHGFDGMKGSFRIGEITCVNITEKLVFGLAIQDSEEVLVIGLDHGGIGLVGDTEEDHVSDNIQDLQESRAEKAVGKECRSQTMEGRRRRRPDSHLDI